MKIAPIRKAVLAFVLPFIGALGGSLSDGDLTGSEALASIGIALVTGYSVYKVPNA